MKGQVLLESGLGLLFLSLLALAMFLILYSSPPNKVFAATWESNGAITSDDIGDGYGDSISSKVWYWKEASPFEADVDYVYYGGRRPDEGACSAAEEWRHEDTEYKEWSGSSWDLVESFGASSWRASATPSLVYYDFEDNVLLEGGGLVKQRLSYRYFESCLFDIVDFTGQWHNHFLE